MPLIRLDNKSDAMRRTILIGLMPLAPFFLVFAILIELVWIAKNAIKEFVTFCTGLPEAVVEIVDWFRDHW